MEWGGVYALRPRNCHCAGCDQGSACATRLGLQGSDEVTWSLFGVSTL